jgi:hypothetical protein
MARKLAAFVGMLAVAMALGAMEVRAGGLFPPCVPGWGC